MIKFNSQTYTAKSRWSKEVKELCGNKCICCGSAGGNTTTTRLESHHVYMRETHPDYENLLENGVCLCHDCHYAAHNGDYTRRGMKTNHKLWNWHGLSTEEVRQKIMVFVSNRFILTMTKEEYDRIKDAADQVGEPVNGYIKKAISRRIEAGD